PLRNNNFSDSRVAPHQYRGGEVLDRAADRLEQGDVPVRDATLGLAAAEVEQVATDAFLGQDAPAQRNRYVARLFGGAGARVDVDAGALDRVVVGLAHLGREAADQIDVRARLEPGAAHDRLGRERRAAHDVGVAHRRLEILRDRRLDAGDR